MPESRSNDPLVWIDCEMTGLDAEKDTILAIACFITDANLKLVEDQGYEAIVHHDSETLNTMNEWCRSHHGASGLTNAVLKSNTSPKAAADELLEYIKFHVPLPKSAILAGSSVHADKEFLRKEPWTAIVDYLNYRILDVSSIKEASRRWGSNELLRNVPEKRKAHLAKDDILESINEARYYRKMLFLGNSATQH